MAQPRSGFWSSRRPRSRRFSPEAGWRAHFCCPARHRSARSSARLWTRRRRRHRSFPTNSKKPCCAISAASWRWRVAPPTRGLSRAGIRCGPHSSWRSSATSICTLRTSGLTPATASAAVDISVRQLHRLFEPSGRSFARYVLRQRLLRCRDTIAGATGTGRSVIDIAFGWGFNSMATFYRAFVSEFGSPPAVLRATSRKDK